MPSEWTKRNCPSIKMAKQKLKGYILLHIRNPKHVWYPLDWETSEVCITSLCNRGNKKTVPFSFRPIYILQGVLIILPTLISCIFRETVSTIVKVMNTIC